MKVAFLTIGQSPRVDVLSELSEYLTNIEYVEYGALDGVGRDELEAFKPSPGETVYVTRLATGEEVRISRRKAEERLQEIIDSKCRDVDFIVLLCTGDFDLKSDRPIIYPGKVLQAFVQSIFPKKLGVIVPLREQIAYAEARWKGLCDSLKATAWSPYREGDVTAAVQGLEDRDLIVLDCMGYSKRHKELVRTLTRRPVLLPRSLLGLILRELS